MKEAIAMKCTQEQYDKIKGKLPEQQEVSSSFCVFNYLTNNFSNKIGNINNTKSPHSIGRKVYETWDEKIFLEACGVCYKITKETILKYKMVDEFPEFFETRLEVGRWYNLRDNDFFFIEKSISSTLKVGYGFCCGDWLELNGYSFSIDKWQEATVKEVRGVLIQESKKRGYKVGDWIKMPSGATIKIEKGSYPDGSIYSYDCRDNYLGYMGFVIFYKGKWAEIIPRITKEEAEKQLACKII